MTAAQKKSALRFVKGTPEAKAHMAKCRAARGKNKPVSKVVKAAKAEIKAVKGERNAVKDAYMATKAPSDAQFNRRNERLTTLGQPTLSRRKFNKAYPTMLDASLAWDKLTA